MNVAYMKNGNEYVLSLSYLTFISDSLNNIFDTKILYITAANLGDGIDVCIDTLCSLYETRQKDMPKLAKITAGRLNVR